MDNTRNTLKDSLIMFKHFPHTKNVLYKPATVTNRKTTEQILVQIKLPDLNSLIPWNQTINQLSSMQHKALSNLSYSSTSLFLSEFHHLSYLL